MRFTDRLNKDDRPLILDGAMGTMLFQALPRFTGCVELLNLENPELIASIHRAYAGAGAQILTTNSFGGSRIKLDEYGQGARCAELNRKAAGITKGIAGPGGLITGGSVGPCGKLIEPLGEVSAAEAYDSFAVQVMGLEEGGADCIIIETMSDLLEAKTALRAAKENTRLPVLCSMTFEDSGKTVTGTDPVTGLATLSEAGADAVGINCSMGPEGIVALMERTADELRGLGIPLAAWANAGLPRVENGRTIYDLGAEQFARELARMISLGVRILGGCCGTTPGHIQALAKAVGGLSCTASAARKSFRYITGRFARVDASAGELLVIGERLNPTARKKFAGELRGGQNTFLREESRRQESEGARILDINVGVPGINEPLAMHECVSILSGLVKTPLMIDSDNPEVIRRALEIYPGIAIINSVNGKARSMEGVVDLVRRFGAFIVALCLDDTGIHRDALRRITIGERLLESLAAAGIGAERVFIDPLMLAESAEPGGAMETLAVIDHFASHGIKTSIGLSNISFGLPARKHINGAFLKLAARRGLSAAIINPAAAGHTGDFLPDELPALDFLEGRDPGATRYIARYRGTDATAAPSASAAAPKDQLESIYGMIVEGNADGIAEAVLAALAARAPEEIMNNALIRGLEKVGELYNTGEYFLPQMIASANAMKEGFAVLKPVLTGHTSVRRGSVVICTVRGDVHDIGKNIVALMLENHGFEVTDLGKDVPSERIIETVRRLRPDIVCLSSLLTTTMNEMRVMSSLLKESGLPVRLMVGGAVVTAEYAGEIGAHYAEDAVAAAARAIEIMNR